MQEAKIHSVTFPDDGRGWPRHDRMVRHIFCDDSPRSHQGPVSDRHSGQDRRVATNTRALPDESLNNLPIRLTLRTPVRIGGSWIKVICKHHAMADKNFVVYFDAFANKAMGRYFASGAHAGILLNFDERSNSRAIADRAAIKIDLVGVKNPDPLAQSHGLIDRHSNSPQNSDK